MTQVIQDILLLSFMGALIKVLFWSLADNQFDLHLATEAIFKCMGVVAIGCAVSYGVFLLMMGYS